MTGKPAKQLAPQAPFPLGKATGSKVRAPFDEVGPLEYRQRGSHGMSMRRHISAIGRRAATARPDAALVLRILLLTRP